MKTYTYTVAGRDIEFVFEDLPKLFELLILAEPSESDKDEIMMRLCENPNYPTRTAQDLEIAGLKRENNAAFERIQELSAALVALGYDPTSKRQ